MPERAMSPSNRAFRALAPHFNTALKSFQSSGSNFRLLKTIDPSDLQSRDPEPLASRDSPKTLFILDSSFNPPSIAHRTLATSALHSSSSSSSPHSTPHRLLLLFATMNADKAPSAASFDQRLTLMTIFAIDLLQHLKSHQPSSSSSIVPIDIGVTTVPYYTDKSAAIYSSPEGQHWYPSRPQHVHCVGFDTLTRFFAAKYYPKHSPPFSALNPFFEAGHALRVTLRPDDEYGSVEEQRAFLEEGLKEDGDLVRDGAKVVWRERIELVDPNPETGVSSTKVRAAAKRGDWGVVEDLCTEGVAGYVREERLYEDDDRGAKMA